MRTTATTIVFILLLSGMNSVVSSQDNSSRPIQLTGGIMTGYNRGYGIKASITGSGFAADFPFKLRFGIGYTFLNPGDAEDARRIFINNATNGVPEKKGRSFDCRLDFLIPKTLFGIDHSYLVFGPRFSTFTGNFVYVGGNEDFDVTSHQWGIGGSLESHFKMTPGLDLVIAAGLDQYFPSTLTGHDTSYSPDNDNVNPQNDNQNGDEPFNYRDADKAIRQPMFMPHVMIGVSFQL